MKTRRRKLWGGEAIEGAQGCVIIPSLVVGTDRRTRNTEYVTKLFFKEVDFEEEKAHNDRILATVDPRGTFTSAKYTTDPIDISSINPKELDSCRGLRGKDISKLKSLNYVYLGKSIHDIVFTDIKINADTSRWMFRSLSNLASKIHYLNIDKKLFHNDVHEGNILFNFQKNYAYLIDFGNLSDNPNGGNELTDLQGLIVAGRLLAITIHSQKRLSKPLLALLSSYIDDAGELLNRFEKTPSKDAPDVIMKFLSDFSLKYTTSVGGKRRTTLRRRSH